MSEPVDNPGNPVGVTILDKQYLIHCEDSERPSLHAAADYLDQKMRAVRQGGGVIGAERLAVMTALNLAAELLAYKKKNADYTDKVNDTLERLRHKIDAAVIPGQQTGAAATPPAGQTES